MSIKMTGFRWFSKVFALCEGYSMNINMTGFRWFSKIFALCEGYSMSINMTGFGWFSKIIALLCIGRKKPRHCKGLTTTVNS